MEIAGYLPTSLIEWPGKIVAVVFVPGCNFRCPFCYNRDLVLNPGKLPYIPEKEILADLEKRKKWVDGVVITGGEPILQPKLGEFIGKIKKLAFEVKLYTNGSSPLLLQKFLKKKLLDNVTLDIKAPLDKSYAVAIGKKKFDPAVIIESIKILLKFKIPFELRTTIVPGIHDKEALFLEAKHLKKAVGKKKISWFWQNFQPKNCLDPKFEKKKPYKKEELEEFLKLVKKYYAKIELKEE